MRIASVGRHDSTWASESDLADAFVALGHDVTWVSENATYAALTNDYDLILWTPSRVSLVSSGMLAVLAESPRRCPVVGVHADRFWGLEREAEMRRSAWMLSCDLLLTADGGHDDEWAQLGVQHEWLPPAIATKDLASDAMLDLPRSGVVFVGKVAGYHASWPHRGELVRHLAEWYGDAFTVYDGHPLLRGEELTKVIASAAVVVGDSCLAGGITRYFSDRCAEVPGRGGALLHPNVEGLTDFNPFIGQWEAGDWGKLRVLCDLLLQSPRVSHDLAKWSRDHSAAWNTWEHRAAEILTICEKRGLL